jgi:hypothetical protein
MGQVLAVADEQTMHKRLEMYAGNITQLKVLEKHSSRLQAVTCT